MRKYLLLFAFTLLYLAESISTAQTTVLKGVADISIHPTNDAPLALDGEWEFYPNNLYTPNDFISGKTIKPIYINVPGLWNKESLTGFNKGIGYGTYKLELKNLTKNKIYALNINRVQSSYKIWINGELCLSVGEPGINKNVTKPKWSSDDIVFNADDSKIEIIIQVSNFHHKKGGIENSIYFAFEEKITDRGSQLAGISIFLLGVLLIMASYHLGMYMFRSNDKVNLFFALALIFTGIFSCTVSEIIFTKVFPDFNWQLIVKTNYISNYLRLLFFILFIYYSFKEQLSKIIIYSISAAILIMSLFSLAAPVFLATHTLIAFLILTGISLVYLIFGQIKAIRAKVPGSFYSFLGILILLFAAVNDFMLEYHIIKTISLTTFGLFIFIILHSYLISIQNASSYRSIKNITEKLKIQGVIKDALFTSDSYNLKAPLKVISDVTETDRTVIFIMQNNNWIALNEFIKKDNKFRKLNLNVFSGKDDIHFSSRTVKKAISSTEYVFQKATDTLNSNELSYFKSTGVNSIFTYPIYKDGMVQALIYLENYADKKGYESKTFEIMDAVHIHLSVYSENFDTYNRLRIFNKELEDRVKRVTNEIEGKNIKLKELREEISTQNEAIVAKKSELEKQNQEINDGIRYAIKIHNAFLSSEQVIKNKFPESFIINRPKDILSGDFYWFANISPSESIIIVADSTGSGVSGALMTFIGFEIINDTVIYNSHKSPKLILNKIQSEFQNRISEENDVIGFDMSVIYINSDKNEIIFAGAQNSIYIVKNNNLIEYRATQISVGHSQMSEIQIKKRFFTNNRIDVKKGETIYMFTDGFIKQIGEKSQRKFMKTNFKDLLGNIHLKPMKEQKVELENIFNNWKGNEAQTDDMLLLGLRL